MIRLFCFTALFCAAATTAYADVDVTPVATTLADLFVIIMSAVITVLAGFVAAWLRPYIGATASDKVNEILRGAGHRGLALGMQKLVPPGASITIDLKNDIIEYGVNYLVRQFPDYTSGIDRHKLRGAVEGWLGEMVGLELEDLAKLRESFVASYKGNQGLT